MSDKVIVNPSFRLDIDGKLFKNKIENNNVQNTLLFNNLWSRLSIVKGDLPLFPNVGLKQHLFNFGFNTKDQLESIIMEFEDDVRNQLKRDCNIIYKVNSEYKTIDLKFELEGLKSSIDISFNSLNNSIKIIENIEQEN